MIRPILIYPTDKDILTQKSEEVSLEDIKSDRIQNLIQDLIDTVKNVSGAGISAVQIGELKQICVINWAGIHVLINPEITRSRGNHLYPEGCLSVPGLYIERELPQKVWISAFNEKGEAIEFAEGGVASRVAQHEIEHFEGKCSLYDAYDTMMEKKENK